MVQETKLRTVYLTSIWNIFSTTFYTDTFFGSLGVLATTALQHDFLSFIVKSECAASVMKIKKSKT